MTVTTEEKNGRLRLKLTGELDHHAAGTLMHEIEDRLDRYLPRDCVVDMGGVSFMDSSGIAVLMKTYRRMNELDGRIWVENVPSQPMRVLDASGLERLMGIRGENMKGST